MTTIITDALRKRRKLSLREYAILILVEIFIALLVIYGYMMLQGMEARKTIIILAGLAVIPVLLVSARASIVFLVIFCSFAQANLHLTENFDLSFVDLFTLAILFTFLFQKLLKGQAIKFPDKAILRYTGAVFFFLFIITLYHLRRVDSIDVLLYNTKNIFIGFLLFYLVACFMNKRNDLKAAAHAILLGLLISACWALLSIKEFDLWAAIHGESAARIKNYAFFHPNILGQFLILTLPMAYFALLLSRKWSVKVLAVISGMVGIAALFFTFSRAAWLAIVIAIVLISLGRKKYLLGFVLATFVTLFLMEFISNYFFKISIWEILEQRFQQLESSRLSLRPFIWKVSLDIIQTHPVFGVGAGFFSDYFWLHPEVIYRRLHAHNTSLMFATEMGIPFALLFFLWLFKVYFQSYRGLRLAEFDNPSIKFIILGLYAGLLGLFFVMLFYDIFYSQLVPTLFFIYCGLIIGSLSFLRKTYNKDPEKL